MANVAIASAPACVGNVAVGFDVLGHTLEGPGDRVSVRRDAGRTIRVEAIRGEVTELPRDAGNTAVAALISLRDALGLDHGFVLEIDKGIPLGSGLAGSAASAVAAVVAADALLGTRLPPAALFVHALAGERVASGGANGDNIGPPLLGGLVLAAEGHLLRVPVPAAWRCVVVRPHLALLTRDARAVLTAPYALADVVAQCGRLALLLAGCERGDVALVRSALRDTLIEPRRAPLVPGFAAVKTAALESGALGASLSGAGPGVFAWYESAAEAARGAAAMQAAFGGAGMSSDQRVSSINGPAAMVVALD